MSNIHTFEEHYIDPVDPKDLRVGQLEIDTDNRTVRWVVSKEPRFLMGWHEFNALLECAKKSTIHEGDSN